MGPTNTNPPSFSALQPRAWTANRLYRVHVLPHELVCVWAGSGNDVALAMAVQGGLVGALLAAAVNPARKNARRQEELDSKPLAELREDHKHNFAVPLADVEEAEVVPASLWFRMCYNGISPIGLLRLHRSGRPTLTLPLTSKDDLRRVLQLLPPQLGDKLRVGLTWDEERGRWVSCPPSQTFVLPPGEEIAVPRDYQPPLSSIVVGPLSRPGPAPGSLQTERDAHEPIPYAEALPVERPQSSRHLLVFGLLAGLLVLGGAGVLVWVVLALRGLSPASQQRANNINNPSGDNWQPFTSPECGFSVSFPRTPEHTSRRASNTPRTMHLFEVKDAQDSYSLVTFTPPLPGQPLHLFQVLKGVRQDFPLGQIGPEKPWSVGPYQGWDFTIRFADRTVLERHVHGRGRDYTLLVTSSRGPAIADDAQRFFDSFRPVDAGAAPPNPRQPTAFQPPTKRLKGPSSELLALAFSGDGKTVMAASQNGEFCTWDVASANQTRTAAFPEQPVRIVAFALSPSGETAAASTLGGQFALRDTATLRPGTVLMNRLTEGMVWSVAFSPDGRHVATGHSDNLVRLWEAAQQRPPRELRGENPAQSLTFTPEGKTLAAGSKGNTVTLWDVDAATVRATLTGSRSEVPSNGAVWALACSRDGKKLAAGGHDQTVRLWDLDTQKELLALKHTQTVRSVAFSPDGKLLASGDDAGSVALWDVTGGLRRSVFPAENDLHAVRALAFSPDGTLLAATVGNEVRLWGLP